MASKSDNSTSIDDPNDGKLKQLYFIIMYIGINRTNNHVLFINLILQIHGRIFLRY